MTECCDIAIVGAGAAGLAAAIFAAEAAQRAGRPVRIVLLDGAARIGTKILISGGGRCNITHDEVQPADYNGSRNIVRNVLAAFDERATVRWFTSLGVQTKREPTGKLFPVSDRASTVLEALLGRCRALGVAVQPGHRVTDVRLLPPGEAAAARDDTAATNAGTWGTGDAGEVKDAGGRTLALPAPPVFSVAHQHGELTAARLIIATGGRSLPRSGSDGGGWEIARRLGHSVTGTVPALVPLVLDDSLFHASLSGISHIVELATYAGEKLIDRRTGSLLWTHFGVSGPVVMDASRHWVLAQAHAAGEGSVELRCNTLPGRSFEQVEHRLIEEGRRQPRTTVVRILAAMLPERVAVALIKQAGLQPGGGAGQLSRAQRRTLVHTLTALRLPVLRHRGWEYAEATAGGVPLNEIDYRTMQSRIVPGLYLAGEMLDCDGRIGGFNFQWAWSTGYVAGKAAGAMSGAEP